MRAIVASCALVLFGLSAVVADDFFFSVSKIEKKGDDYVITGKKKKAKKDDDAPKEMTYTVSGKVKVAKGKVNFDKETKKATVEAGDPIEKGFGDEVFSTVSADKMVNLYLTTEGEGDKVKVTRVLYLPGKKKKTE
jgi:hypothetical protein